jgi:hypothetical protein
MKATPKDKSKDPTPKVNPRTLGTGFFAALAKKSAEAKEKQLTEATTAARAIHAVKTDAQVHSEGEGEGKGEGKGKGKRKRKPKAKDEGPKSLAEYRRQKAEREKSTEEPKFGPGGLPLTGDVLYGLPGEDRVYFLHGNPGMSERSLGRILAGYWVNSEIAESAEFDELEGVTASPKSGAKKGSDRQLEPEYKEIKGVTGEQNNDVTSTASSPAENHHLMRRVGAIPAHILDSGDLAGIPCWCAEENQRIIWWSPENVNRVVEGFRDWWLTTLNYKAELSDHRESIAQAKRKRAKCRSVAPVKLPHKLMTAQQRHLGRNCNEVLTRLARAGMVALVNEVAGVESKPGVMMRAFSFDIRDSKRLTPHFYRKGVPKLIREHIANASGSKVVPAQTYKDVWESMLTTEGLAVLREWNPRLFGRAHYQLVTNETYAYWRRVFAYIGLLAEEVGNNPRAFRRLVFGFLDTHRANFDGNNRVNLTIVENDPLD